MKRILILVACVFVFLILAAALAAQQQPARHVVLISIDGLGPDYYRRPEELGIKLPNLEALRDQGSWAWGVVGQYPSVTYPSHTSMVTGVRPARHGIVYNTMFDAAGGSRDWFWQSTLIRVPTLWDLAIRRGLKSGAVSWPATIGAKIDYNIPEGGSPPAGATSLDYHRKISTPGLVDEVMERITPAVIENTRDPIARDRFITEASVHIISKYRPNLMLVHLIHTDSAQHNYGPFSPEAKRAFESTDVNVGRIVQATEAAGIRQNTTFIITGDHGFYRIHSALQPNVILRKAGFLKTDSEGNVVEWDAVAHSAAIRLWNPTDSDLAARVEGVFQRLAGEQYRGIFRVVSRAELDELGAYPEAAFFLEPVEGYLVSAGFQDDAFVVPTDTRGTHGFLPGIPQMHTGLIASGAGIKQGIQIPLARQIDIAPTVATLLGMDMSRIEGVAMMGILQK